MVSGSRLLELELLLRDKELMSYCKFTVVDGCNTCTENMQTMFECMKVYLGVTNRWSSTEVETVETWDFNSEAHGDRGRALSQMAGMLLQQNPSSPLVDVANFGNTFGYSTLCDVGQFMH